MKLVIASSNKGKLREYNDLLSPLGFEVISAKDAGIDIEVEETGTTFAENSALKARAIYDMCHECVLADDSGLCVDALDGAPGVFSARFGGMTTDKDRIELLLEKLKDVPDEKRSAHFMCTIHFIYSDGREIAVEGRVDGKIAFAPSGDYGFGYDPVFLYNGVSFASVDSKVKNEVSHRANALKALLQELDRGVVNK
ncbi:MAG: RdgB/HAM1 family non-canonical purine NTP pyrophosphatase [Ruminococcus sp.]|nr:RdgB/HAM1 family non-canonical purine NTP pyrophosphatase [Ruminococcus sp.]